MQGPKFEQFRTAWSYCF